MFTGIRNVLMLGVSGPPPGVGSPSKMKLLVLFDSSLVGWVSVKVRPVPPSWTVLLLIWFWPKSFQTPVSCPPWTGATPWPLTFPVALSLLVPWGMVRVGAASRSPRIDSKGPPNTGSLFRKRGVVKLWPPSDDAISRITLGLKSTNWKKLLVGGALLVFQAT